MILYASEVIKRRKMFTFFSTHFILFLLNITLTFSWNHGCRYGRIRLGYLIFHSNYFNNQHADLKENCHGHCKHHLAEDICSGGNKHCNNQDDDINMLTVGHKSIIFYKSVSNKDGENYWELEYQTEDCCGCCYKWDEIENRISCSYPWGCCINVEELKKDGQHEKIRIWSS